MVTSNLNVRSDQYGMFRSHEHMRGTYYLPRLGINENSFFAFKSRLLRAILFNDHANLSQMLISANIQDSPDVIKLLCMCIRDLLYTDFQDGGRQKQKLSEICSNFQATVSYLLATRIASKSVTITDYFTYSHRDSRWKGVYKSDTNNDLEFPDKYIDGTYTIKGLRVFASDDFDYIPYKNQRLIFDVHDNMYLYTPSQKAYTMFVLMPNVHLVDFCQQAYTMSASLIRDDNSFWATDKLLPNANYQEIKKNDNVYPVFILKSGDHLWYKKSAKIRKQDHGSIIRDQEGYLWIVAGDLETDYKDYFDAHPLSKSGNTEASVTTDNQDVVVITEEKRIELETVPEDGNLEIQNLEDPVEQKDQLEISLDPENGHVADFSRYRRPLHKEIYDVQITNSTNSLDPFDIPPAIIALLPSTIKAPMNTYSVNDLQMDSSGFLYFGSMRISRMYEVNPGLHPVNAPVLEDDPRPNIVNSMKLNPLAYLEPQKFTTIAQASEEPIEKPSTTFDVELFSPLLDDFKAIVSQRKRTLKDLRHRAERAIARKKTFLYKAYGRPMIDDYIKDHPLDFPDPKDRIMHSIDHKGRFSETDLYNGLNVFLLNPIDFENEMLRRDPSTIDLRRKEYEAYQLRELRPKKPRPKKVQETKFAPLKLKRAKKTVRISGKSFRKKRKQFVKYSPSTELYDLRWNNMIRSRGILNAVYEKPSFEFDPEVDYDLLCAMIYLLREAGIPIDHPEIGNKTTALETHLYTLDVSVLTEIKKEIFEKDYHRVRNEYELNFDIKNEESAKAVKEYKKVLKETVLPEIEQLPEEHKIKKYLRSDGVNDHLDQRTDSQIENREFVMKILASDAFREAVEDESKPIMTQFVAQDRDKEINDALNLFFESADDIEQKYESMLTGVQARQAKLNAFSAALLHPAIGTESEVKVQQVEHKIDLPISVKLPKNNSKCSFKSRTNVKELRAGKPKHRFDCVGSWHTWFDKDLIVSEELLKAIESVNNKHIVAQLREWPGSKSLRLLEESSSFMIAFVLRIRFSSTELTKYFPRTLESLVPDDREWNDFLTICDQFIDTEELRKSQARSDRLRFLFFIRFRAICAIFLENSIVQQSEVHFDQTIAQNVMLKVGPNSRIFDHNQMSIVSAAFGLPSWLMKNFTLFYNLFTVNVIEKPAEWEKHNCQSLFTTEYPEILNARNRSVKMYTSISSVKFDKIVEQYKKAYADEVSSLICERKTISSDLKSSEIKWTYPLVNVNMRKTKTVVEFNRIEPPTFRTKYIKTFAEYWVDPEFENSLRIALIRSSGTALIGLNGMVQTAHSAKHIRTLGFFNWLKCESLKAQKLKASFTTEKMNQLFHKEIYRFKSGEPELICNVIHLLNIGCETIYGCWQPRFIFVNRIIIRAIKKNYLHDQYVSDHVDPVFFACLLCSQPLQEPNPFLTLIGKRALMYHIRMIVRTPNLDQVFKKQISMTQSLLAALSEQVEHKFEYFPMLEATKNFAVTEKLLDDLANRSDLDPNDDPFIVMGMCGAWLKKKQTIGSSIFDHVQRYNCALMNSPNRFTWLKHQFIFKPFAPDVQWLPEMHVLKNALQFESGTERWPCPHISLDFDLKYTFESLDTHRLNYVNVLNLIKDVEGESSDEKFDLMTKAIVDRLLYHQSFVNVSKIAIALYWTLDESRFLNTVEIGKWPLALLVHQIKTGSKLTSTKEHIRVYEYFRVGNSPTILEIRSFEQFEAQCKLISSRMLYRNIVTLARHFFRACQKTIVGQVLTDWESVSADQQNATKKLQRFDSCGPLLPFDTCTQASTGNCRKRAFTEMNYSSNESMNMVTLSADAQKLMIFISLMISRTAAVKKVIPICTKRNKRIGFFEVEPGQEVVFEESGKAFGYVLKDQISYKFHEKWIGKPKTVTQHFRK